jgi:hypothetical protein
VKVAKREIIRGDVSILRGGAGGLSYFSSGSLRDIGEVGGSCPEARSTATSESRQARDAAFKVRKKMIIRRFPA